ncbi:MAG: alpha/beta hydrolase [Dehalococcoidales bacterium]|nr:MAG: alpha/beta hydrolase [Dehalococcoidales bacterium]
MPYSKVGDINMYYEVHGTGEPLVFINGWFMPLGLFYLLVPVFAQEYQVITFDNRGAGKSDAPEGPYSLEIMAQDLAGLLDVIGVQRAHFLGHSMGARIAEEMALHFPEKVNSIILAGPITYSSEIGWQPGPVTKEEIKFWEELSLEEWAWRLLSERVNDDFISNNRELAENLVNIIMDGCGPLHARVGHTNASRLYDNFTRLPEITTPTLILAGRDDKTVPLENILVLKERMPGAELAILDNVRHFMILEAFDESNRIILDFLRRHSGSE